MKSSEYQELLRLIQNVVRTGAVSSVEGKRVRVQWPDGVVSRAMPYAGSSSALDAAPAVGDQALVIAIGGDPASSFAVLGLSTVDADRGNKSGASRSDKVQAQLEILRTAFDNHTHANAAPGTPSPPIVAAPPPPSPPIIPVSGDPQWDPDTAANFVKVD